MVVIQTHSFIDYMKTSWRLSGGLVGGFLLLGLRDGGSDLGKDGDANEHAKRIRLKLVKIEIN